MQLRYETSHFCLMADKACWQLCETVDTKGTHQRPFVSYHKYIHYFQFDLVITVLLCVVSQQKENKFLKINC